MKVVQINILKDIRSTGRTTIELHNYLLKCGIDSYIAYGIGKKSCDARFYKISNKFDYFFHNLAAFITKKEGYFSYFSTKRLIKWLSKIQPDVVHLRNIHESFLNLKLLFSYLSKKKIRVVITTHDFWFMTPTCSCVLCNYKPLICEHCDNCSSVFFNSKKYFLKKKKMIDSLETLYIQCNSFFSESIVNRSFLSNKPHGVIYNWIDFNKFYPEIDKSVFGCEFNKPIVLCVWSLLDPNLERFKFFVKIANILYKEYEFVMVGKYDFDVSQFPNIHFIQSVSINELRKIYSSANVLFNPSTADSFGKVVAECLSCGTPALVFDNQALPELVGENGLCGFAVEPFNVDMTIEYLHKIISNGKEYYEKNCVDRSHRLFDYNNNCAMLLNIYEGNF